MMRIVRGFTTPALLLVCYAMIVSCAEKGTSTGGSVDSLTDRLWVLESLGPVGAETPPGPITTPGRTPEMKLGHTTGALNTGVNCCAFECDWDSLSPASGSMGLSIGGCTLVGGSQATIAAENALKAALRSVTRYELRGDILRLFYPGPGNLIFRAADPGAEPSCDCNLWKD